MARAGNLVGIRIRDLFVSAFYLANLVPISGATLHHTWSLAVEEQFYLVWPACMALFPRGLWPWIVGIGLAAKPLLKILASGGYPSGVIALNSSSFDAIFIGVALALWMNRPGKKWRDREGSTRWMRFDLVLVLCLVGLLMLYHEAYLLTNWVAVIAPVLRNILVGLVLFYCLSRTSGFAIQVLTSSLVVWIGLLSYSIYLWQQPLLVGEYPFVG